MRDLDPNWMASPPSWSLALGEGAKALVLIAIAAFAGAAITSLLSKKHTGLSAWAGRLFGAGCVALFAVFGALATLFVANRFEFEYVFGHTDTKNSIPYRIAGIWAGQEGSFLLWAVCAAMFGLIGVRIAAQYRRWLIAVYSIFLGGLANILAFESPFKLNLFEGKPVVPQEGIGLSPALQNYWVIIHPPTIFLGFGALTLLFALAFAAMMEKDLDGWVPIVRPWNHVATTLVGLGLAMGGFWAYETLGWGGFWMWDPVENVSFVPWCFCIALTHGLIVQATRKSWKFANLMLAGIPLLSFVYGTFMTRSGLLSEASVHSFAEMDRSALKLLTGVLGITFFGFMGTWAVRFFQMKNEPMPTDEGTGFRRESFYRAGVLTALLMGIAAMIGMSVPFIMALTGQKPQVVQEVVYHQVMPYVFVPFMILMGITPFVSWRSMTPKDLFGRAYSIFCVAVGITGLMLCAAVFTPFRGLIDLAPTMQMFGDQRNGLWWMLVMTVLCLFALVGNIWRVAELKKQSKLGWSPFIAHIGVAVMMTGLIISRGFEQEARTFVSEKEPGNVLGYQVTFAGITKNMMDRDNLAKFEFRDPHKKNELLFVATPGLYNVQQGDQLNTMVWPYIGRGVFHDIYVSLSTPQKPSSEATLQVGKTVPYGNYKLTYQKMVREGESGMLGTRFGAQIRLVGEGRDEIITPKMEIGGGGTVPHPVAIDPETSLSMVSMNAADNSVTLRVELNTTVYPVEVFHKPLVSFVWIGTFLMTLGGFGSAVYRRNRRASKEALVDAPTSQAEAQPEPVLMPVKKHSPKGKLL